MGSDGQIGGGWVWVVGYGGGWVEMGRSVVGGFGLWVMAVGESVVVGGSTGGQIGGGADLCSDMFLSLFFCFGGGFGGG